MRSATTLTRLAALALIAATAGAAAPPADAAFPGGNGKIALARFYVPGTPSTSIFTVNPAGGSPTVLIRNGRLNFDPAWSANGNDLAFDSCPSTTNCNIFTARADGTGATRITNNPYFEEFPRWGPDGDRLRLHAPRRREHGHLPQAPRLGQRHAADGLVRLRRVPRVLAGRGDRCLWQQQVWEL